MHRDEFSSMISQYFTVVRGGRLPKHYLKNHTRELIISFECYTAKICANVGETDTAFAILSLYFSRTDATGDVTDCAILDG